MKKYLDEQLISYSKSDYYPFHMPGHKRQRLGDWIPEEIDITEIDGFDNLHHAQGIIKEGQERLAGLTGADQSFYLVNGSTSGLLAAICGSVKKGDRILVGRNSHKAVYHAAYLMELKVEYLYPEPTVFGIQGSILPEQVKNKLKQFPDVSAVVITSPTYDGVVSDIASIAEIVHGYDIPLIVDEAHGAHFGFSEDFPRKAVSLGADLCIESLHKTLPSYTQTAVLHMVKTRRIVSRKESDDTSENREYRMDPDRVKRYLGIYQSSSPSYVFMAGIDRCVRMLQQDAVLYKSEATKEASLFGAFEQRLKKFYQVCSEFQYVQVFPYMDAKHLYAEAGYPYREPGRLYGGMLFSGREPGYSEGRGCISDMETGIWAKDNSKILISAERAGLHGQQLYDLLLNRYHLQMEMASGHYVTAITTIMDTEEGFKRLLDALREIDMSAAGQQDKNECAGSKALCDAEPGKNADDFISADASFTPLELYQPGEKRMEIAQAMDAPKREILLKDAAGCISGEFIYLYPPGIPMVAPGELITEQILHLIDVCRQRNMQVQGMQDMGGKYVQVI